MLEIYIDKRQIDNELLDLLEEHPQGAIWTKARGRKVKELDAEWAIIFLLTGYGGSFKIAEEIAALDEKPFDVALRSRINKWTTRSSSIRESDLTKAKRAWKNMAMVLLWDLPYTGILDLVSSHPQGLDFCKAREKGQIEKLTCYECALFSLATRGKASAVARAAQDMEETKAIDSSFLAKAKRLGEGRKDKLKKNDVDRIILAWSTMRPQILMPDHPLLKPGELSYTAILTKSRSRDQGKPGSQPRL